MCGIAGFISKTRHPAEQMTAEARKMCDAIAHRGPDSDGFWVDPELGVALGHRRLAIVDLSPQGHQPMASACGRYMLVFNGEIYNHSAIRTQLPDVSWRGHSDTETILAAITVWGLRATLDKLVGMFAIVLWDRETRRMFMARDRIGEKPLYYGHLPNGDFIFGSELKALRAYGDWHPELNRDALALYMRHNCVSGTHTIYRNVFKLAPGHWAEILPHGKVASHEYWSLTQVAQAGVAAPLDVSDEEALSAFERLLSAGIRDQMVADVPLGAFLSGGVDSSAIVSLMQANSRLPVKTFSIGFEQPGLNEAEHAKAVAAHLRTEHTELYVTGAEALDVIPQLAQIYDEPFADSSQIPTYLVSKMARRHVTVALSGDAGDELLLGYNRYLLAQNTWSKLACVPLGVRRVAARGVLSIPPTVIEAGVGWIPRLKRHGMVGDKAHKFADLVMPARSPADMYRRLISHTNDTAAMVPGSREPSTWASPGALPALDSAVNGMALSDQLTYLPDDILVKVDRAAMANSLETRVPLLDHRLVEFCWRLPARFKIRQGQTKWILRQVLYRHVPRELIERPKQGFAVPLGDWLRGPLKDWASDLLDTTALRQDGYLNAARVDAMWTEHLAGMRNWQYQLWDVLMFQAWRRRYL